MLIFKTFTALQEYLQPIKAAGQTVGFVPTMGALHKGHLSLIEASKSSNTYTVCSIFVNPTQFNDPNDLEKYPRNVQRDIVLLEQAQLDVLFLPTVEEVYPTNLAPLPHFQFGKLPNILEGAHRPGHFDGVVQVMHRFLNQIRPTQVFMGKKDYQQQLIVTHLIAQMGIATQLIPGVIIRDSDGLAMSSRNERLDAHQRQLAPTIHLVLKDAQAQVNQTPVEALRIKSTQKLEAAGFQVEYFEIVDPEYMNRLNGGFIREAVICTASWLGDIRLIDNLEFQAVAVEG